MGQWFHTGRADLDHKKRPKNKTFHGESAEKPKRLSREAGDAPSLEMFKFRWHRAPSW